MRFGSCHFLTLSPFNLSSACGVKAGPPPPTMWLNLDVVLGLSTNRVTKPQLFQVKICCTSPRSRRCTRLSFFLLLCCGKFYHLNANLITEKPKLKVCPSCSRKRCSLFKKNKLFLFAFVYQDLNFGAVGFAHFTHQLFWSCGFGAAIYFKRLSMLIGS